MRVYFYKTPKGDLKRYFYCSLCGAGPFKEEDENKEYKVTLNGTILHCMKCLRTLGIKENVEDHEVFFSGKKPAFEKEESEQAPSKVRETKKKSKPEPKPKTEQEPEPEAKQEPETKIEQKPGPELKPEISQEPGPKTEPEQKKKSEKKQTPVSKPISKEENMEKLEYSTYTQIIRSERDGKKAIPFKGLYTIYIAEHPDEFFSVAVTKDLEKDAEAINSDEEYLCGKAPAEIVFFRKEQNEESAKIIRRVISKLKRKEKEKLIKMFEWQYFR